MTSARRGIVPAVMAGMKPQTPYTAPGLAWMIGATRRQVDQALRRLAIAGQLGMRRVGGGRVYFTTQADADAFSDRDAASLAEQARERRAENTAAANRRRLKAAGLGRHKVVPPKPGVPAAVHIPVPPQIDRPVDMSQAVLTIAKTPACRFAVDPADITPGAFLLDLPAGRWSDYALRRSA